MIISGNLLDKIIEALSKMPIEWDGRQIYYIGEKIRFFLKKVAVIFVSC